MNKFERAISLIDEVNSTDPTQEVVGDTVFPKELLYSLRMSQQLLEFLPDASEELQLAARAQHIKRWAIPRESYPMDRIGYLKWREDLKVMHAKITDELLLEAGYGEEIRDRVTFLVKKKLIKKDSESQTLEDVICLVFLKHYFEDFSRKHSDEKLIDILRKTWQKMSEKGRKAALNLKLSDTASDLLNAALN